MESRELSRSAPPPPSAELLRTIAGARRVETRRPARALAFTVAASLAYAAAMLFALGRGPNPMLRRDLFLQPPAVMIALGLLWAIAFAVSLGVAVLPRKGQATPRAGAARWAWFGAPAALMLVSLALARAVPGVSLVARDGADLFYSTLRCSAAALVVAALPLAAGMLALRRAVTVGARAIGAALGVAGAALGGLVLHLHCAWAEPLHVALGHGGAVVAGALLGALIAPLAIDAR